MYDGFDIDSDLRPQPGPQEQFLSTPADIAIYGGAAGGGKTYALLLEPLRHIDNSDFGAVIFRREAVQITSEGGLFDTSFQIYMRVDGSPKMSPHRMWQFPSSATITFSHLHNEKDVNDWQGSQIPLIGYDELTHFSEKQFWYMLSRNRSLCGVRPYIRATCNPDADSWVADLVSWYIDQDTGYPIPERSGVIRYFVRTDDKMIWGNSRQELVNQFPAALPKSFTFIPATLEDNVILNEQDPDYRANLEMMTRVERERLLHGNWKIKPTAGSYFPQTCINVIPAEPTDVKIWIRRWDLAATEPSEVSPSPSATASVLMGRRENGRFVIADGINIRRNASIVRDILANTAAQDRSKYRRVTTVVPQDPGQAGKDQSASIIAHLAGYKVKSIRETGPKATRAEPLSAQWQAGNVDVVDGPWVRDYLKEMAAFPEGDHDDYVDASSGAFLECVAGASAYEKYLALSS
jgi:predicted phage terminase large subunit-like protein